MKKIKLFFVVFACTLLLSACKTNKNHCLLVKSATEFAVQVLGK